ncbi:hypothetical protein [Lysinibacillus sp. RC79]|uniref:hypothetical protein n=1 Tax=Lysinibacillus sp. RC79 TaxID=3156296 RepID=UPI003519C04F
MIPRNRVELENNGVKVMPHSEIKAMVYEENMSLYKISKRGATVFTKRANLLVGMLLRDSEATLNEVASNLCGFTTLSIKSSLTSLWELFCIEQPFLSENVYVRNREKIEVTLCGFCSIR